MNKPSICPWVAPRAVPNQTSCNCVPNPRNAQVICLDSDDEQPPEQSGSNPQGDVKARNSRNAAPSKRRATPPQDYDRALGTVLLQVPRRGVFLLSE